MKEYFLEKTILFRGTDLEEIKGMLKCLQGTERHFEKGDIIYNCGDTVRFMGMVLSGAVHIESNDFWGNKSILDSIGPGQIFAETYACVPGEPLMVDVVAAEDTDVLFLDANRIMTTCSNACEHHNKLIRNLLMASAQKNLNLSRRIFHTAPKSIRGRILSYLSDQASKQGSPEFDIPFNRQQLADYLNVERSALSNELSKMQKDGLITAKKNHFFLKGDID